MGFRPSRWTRTATPTSSMRSCGTGLGSGECLMWIPAGSPMKGAGTDGRDIGATIVNRYQNGTLTSTPLWNRDTGAFPCGAIVAGVDGRCHPVCR